MSWVRRTEVVDQGAMPVEVVAAFERSALGVGVGWPPGIDLCWRTTSTTTVGKLRKRERAVTVHGVLGPDVIGWAVSDDGDAPGAIVVRRSRVDVFAGLGLSPQLVALAAEGAVQDGADGVSIRGDLGSREISTYFMGLGDGADAERVRTALLA